MRLGFCIVFLSSVQIEKHFPKFEERGILYNFYPELQKIIKCRGTCHFAKMCLLISDAINNYII